MAHTKFRIFIQWFKSEKLFFIYILRANAKIMILLYVAHRSSFNTFDVCVYSPVPNSRGGSFTDFAEKMSKNGTFLEQIVK